MGDAFNMRHPLTWGGMTVALSDIVVLRNLLKPLRDLNDAPNLCKYLESFYTLRKVIMCCLKQSQPQLPLVFFLSSKLKKDDVLAIKHSCSYLALLNV